MIWGCHLSLVIHVAKSPLITWEFVWIMQIIYKCGPHQPWWLDFSYVPTEHGEIITSTIQMFEVVYELTRMWLENLIFFNPVEPLERVVVTSDDQKVGPRQSWKPVCMCVRVCVCVCACVGFLTTFSWIWQLETEILIETSSVDETKILSHQIFYAKWFMIGDWL